MYRPEGHKIRCDYIHCYAGMGMDMKGEADMSTIGVIVENERFQDIIDVLEQIEENTRPKSKPKSEDVNVNHLRDLFFVRLNEKTGWGRNELKRVFDECM